MKKEKTEKKKGFRKFLKVLLIIVIVIALIAAGILLIRNIRAKHHEPLVSYRYSYGGGMEGSSEMNKIKRLDDDTAMIVYESSDWVFQDPDVSEYLVPASVLDEIEKVFDDYKMYKYEHLPNVPFTVLDKGTESYGFSFEDYDSVRFDDNQIIPKKGYEAINRIDSIMSDAAASGKRLPGLVLEDLTNDDYIKITSADGEVNIRVYEYCEDHLNYRIHNGTDEDIQLNGRVEVFRLDGHSRKLIAYDEDYDGYFSVYRHHFREESIELDERLEEGTYLICLDNIESEFIIGDSSVKRPKATPYPYTEEQQGSFVIRTYRNSDGKRIAESYGFEIDDYFKDLDGDGVKEIICNCVAGGDGHRQVYVFRMNGEIPERGTLRWDEDLLTGLVSWGVNAVQSYYDPDRGLFVIEYTSEGNEIREFTTDSLDDFEFADAEG